MHFTSGFSRREFLAHASCFGVFYLAGHAYSAAGPRRRVGR